MDNKTDNKKMFYIGGAIFALVVVVVIVIVIASSSKSSSSSSPTPSYYPSSGPAGTTQPAVTTPPPPKPVDYEMYGPYISGVKQPEAIVFVPAINKYVAMVKDDVWLKMVDLDMTTNRYAPDTTVFDASKWNTYLGGGGVVGYKVRRKAA